MISPFDAIAGLSHDDARPAGLGGPSAGVPRPNAVVHWRSQEALAVAKQEEAGLANTYGFLGGPLLSDASNRIV